MKLVEKVRYAQAYSFKYSPRPGTPGAERKDQVPEEVKTERLLRLQKLISKQQLEFNQSMVGKTIPVLFSDKKGKHQNQIIGKSPYMQSVCIDDSEDKYRDKIVNVKVLEARQSSLLGCAFH